MLNNFHGQFNKNFLFHAPGSGETFHEAPKAPNPEKPDSNKPDFSKPADRSKLYKRTEAAIKNLRASPDKNNWKIAKDLEHSLNVTRQNDQLKFVEAAYAAAQLNDKLNIILKGEPQKPTAKPDSTIVFQEDSITRDSAKELARAKLLSDTVGSFGMIGLLNKTEEAKPVLKVEAVEAPKTPFQVVAVNPTDVPRQVKSMADPNRGDNLGLEGTGTSKYFASNDGKTWKVTYKTNGTLKWESVTRSV